MRHLFITFHPRFTIAHPMSVITDRRRYTGVTITGYVIIVTAAVAIDPTMHVTACLINPYSGISIYSNSSRQINCVDPITMLRLLCQ